MEEIKNYTVTETAKILGIHERNVRELIRTKRLEAVEINGKAKVTAESIKEVLPGFMDDPNPDREIKKQRNPNKEDYRNRMAEKSARNDVKEIQKHLRKRF